MHQLCQALIPINEQRSTYCMRERGHEGKCDFIGEVKQRLELTKIPLGFSVTETEIAYYFRIRNEKEIKTFRIRKDDILWDTDKIE